MEPLSVGCGTRGGRTLAMTALCWQGSRRVLSLLLVGEGSSANCPGVLQMLQSRLQRGVGGDSFKSRERLASVVARSGGSQYQMKVFGFRDKQLVS